MTPAEWIALAERCEAAKGPDRALDAAICVAANYAGPDNEGAINIRVEPEFGPDELCFEIGDKRLCGWLPELTASLDAVAALWARSLPEMDCEVTVRRVDDRRIYRGFVKDAEALFVATSLAATEALARLASFCRAMAAEGSDR